MIQTQSTLYGGNVKYDWDVPVGVLTIHMFVSETHASREKLLVTKKIKGLDKYF